MFCPKCGTEYREEAVKCSDCGAPLVAEPPSKDTDSMEWEDLVTVLSSSDPAVIAVAKSLLEEAGIRYFAKGEGLQDLFALGRVGGFNPIMGPVEFQVPKASEQQARELLEDLEKEMEDFGGDDADE